MQATGTLKQWRARNNLTQVEAAELLCVSQPYLSLLESGARPLTRELRDRMKLATPQRRRQEAGDGSVAAAVVFDENERFRRQLSALGYPGFAHVTRSRVKSKPDVLLLSMLARGDVDSRVVEALPWLVRQYAEQLNAKWLVPQAKLQNLQNRLGFALQWAGGNALLGSELAAAVTELERARLLQEGTLCWDSMPAATREWMRTNRSRLAKHWNLLTRLGPPEHDPVEGPHAA